MIKIYLASPRGFCAGVDYALGMVEKAIELFDEPIYILREIVHNRQIVQEFTERGIKSINSLEEVPENSVIIFSAHGVPPEFHTIAKERNLFIVDATCPLVKKVHLEAISFAKQGYTILYIGHRGHEEAIGVLAEAPNNIYLINSLEEAENIQLANTDKIAYLTQTTLSLSETDKIINILKKRFPNIVSPKVEDICYATTNRQKAVSEMAKLCDLVLVIGSGNSSNSQRLRERAEEQGCKAYLIESKDFIDKAWLTNKKAIGITSGASAPEKLVQDVLAFLKEQLIQCELEEIEFIKENMYFPVNIRPLAK